MFKIGAIGAGHMGMAILDAMNKSTESSEILVYEADAERRRQVKARGFITAGSEGEVYINSRILLMALRPQVCEEVLVKLRHCTGKSAEGPVILNIMAGISAKFIRSHLGKNTSVISVMPSLGMISGQGAATIAHTYNTPAGVLSYIVEVFSAVGEAVLVDEADIMDIVPVNGCMPGYVYYLLDAFASGAKGTDYQTAVRMAARGFIGAATQILEGGDPKDLLAQVCTPGGLTAQGVDSFRGNQLDRLIAEGMEQSVKRGYELGR